MCRAHCRPQCWLVARGGSYRWAGHPHQQHDQLDICTPLLKWLRLAGTPADLRHECTTCCCTLPKHCMGSLQNAPASPASRILTDCSRRKRKPIPLTTTTNLQGASAGRYVRRHQVDRHHHSRRQYTTRVLPSWRMGILRDFGHHAQHQRAADNGVQVLQVSTGLPAAAAASWLPAVWGWVCCPRCCKIARGVAQPTHPSSSGLPITMPGWDDSEVKQAALRQLYGIGNTTNPTRA